MKEPKKNAYRHYLLAVLVLILASNYVDRLALGLLLQDIKIDLGLSDTQLGLMTGIAFALFYSLVGVLIARWADRGNRVTIICVTVALWSAMVALCGMAMSFVQLLLIRVGVAVGEAGCIPPAHSLIADYFTRAERPRATSIYLLGIPLSTVVGYFLAGWLNELYGWRVTFMLLGLPGMGLAALAWFTLREPRCEKPNIPVAATIAGPSLKEVCSTLWGNVTFRHLLLAYAVHSFFAQGIYVWKPAFFIRSYGLNTGELGTWFAVINGLSGLLGLYLGGLLATRHANHDERLQLKVIALVTCCFGALSTGIYLAPHLYLAFGFMALASIGGNAIFGPFFATIQTLVPQRMRAMSIALIYLFANLIGMGLGPLAAGAMSDAFQPLAGEESLRYVLLALCPGYLWAGWHFWRASRTVTADLNQVNRSEAGRCTLAF